MHKIRNRGSFVWHVLYFFAHGENRKTQWGLFEVTFTLNFIQLKGGIISEGISNLAWFHLQKTKTLSLISFNLNNKLTYTQIKCIELEHQNLLRNIMY